MQDLKKNKRRINQETSQHEFREDVKKIYLEVINQKDVIVTIKNLNAIVNVSLVR